MRRIVRIAICHNASRGGSEGGAGAASGSDGGASLLETDSIIADSPEKDGPEKDSSE